MGDALRPPDPFAALYAAVERQDEPPPEQPKSPSRIAILVSVRRTVGSGLTQEVTNLLKYNPRRVFTLRDVLNSIRPNAFRCEVNSILHKLAHDKKQVVRGVGAGTTGIGRRVVATYKWRLPGE